jgi:hypothetical protein
LDLLGRPAMLNAEGAKEPPTSAEGAH